jgi:hypothetical protein
LRLGVGNVDGPSVVNPQADPRTLDPGASLFVRAFSYQARRGAEIEVVPAAAAIVGTEDVKVNWCFSPGIDICH